ncbi:MAG: hypothetical protein FJZ56_02040 [Chlamydiae bacterium]|nr:hypothetical protein [Chlamydiota bacterium]
MFRFLYSLITIAGLGYGSYWVSLTHPEVKNKVLEFLNAGTPFHTLEARFSAKQIMDAHKRELLKDDKHRYLEPVTKFSPYLLLEVKYSHNDTHTGEGVILWDLLDGEMVTHTRQWEKTHGFGDCITANVDKNEFKIINLLAQKGGVVDRELLFRLMQLESETLSPWIESCRRKKLVVQNGSQIRLHLQKPKINVRPETIIDDRLVTKSCKDTERLKKRFTKTQIRYLAEAAFGYDFAIRSYKEVYLPIYAITVENPDGSLHTSYWNAINGASLPFTALLE